MDHIVYEANRAVSSYKSKVDDYIRSYDEYCNSCYELERTVTDLENEVKDWERSSKRRVRDIRNSCYELLRTLESEKFYNENALVVYEFDFVDGYIREKERSSVNAWFGPSSWNRDFVFDWGNGSKTMIDFNTDSIEFELELEFEDFECSYRRYDTESYSECSKFSFCSWSGFKVTQFDRDDNIVNNCRR